MVLGQGRGRAWYVRCNIDCLHLGAGNSEVEMKQYGVLFFFLFFPALLLYSPAQSRFGYFRASHWSANPFAPLHWGYLKQPSVSLSNLSILVSLYKFYLQLCFSVVRASPWLLCSACYKESRNKIKHFFGCSVSLC